MPKKKQETKINELLLAVVSYLGVKPKTLEEAEMIRRMAGLADSVRRKLFMIQREAISLVEQDTSSLEEWLEDVSCTLDEIKEEAQELSKSLEALRQHFLGKM